MIPINISLGIYTWDTDSYTKQTYEEPWKRALMIDWVSENDNGTYRHYAEPRHSPLQPLPEHAEKCTRIPHLWRRQFCGMVVGLDEGIRNITETALEVLGNNTIIIVTSDNGG